MINITHALTCGFRTVRTRAEGLTCTCGLFHDRLDLVRTFVRTSVRARADPLTCPCGLVRTRAEDHLVHVRGQSSPLGLARTSRTSKINTTGAEQS